MEVKQNNLINSLRIQPIIVVIRLEKDFFNLPYKRNKLISKINKLYNYGIKNIEIGWDGNKEWVDLIYEIKNNFQHILPPWLKPKIDTSSLFRFSFLINELINHNADKDSVLFNLGGGVVSDLGGDCSSEHSSDTAQCYPLKVSVFKPTSKALVDWASPVASNYNQLHGL